LLNRVDRQARYSGLPPKRSRANGYYALWLETRLVNERYGYQRDPNFGSYAGNPKAVCFEKRLSHGAGAEMTEIGALHIR